jgi:hypothetical protein
MPAIPVTWEADTRGREGWRSSSSAAKDSGFNTQYHKKEIIDDILKSRGKVEFAWTL